MDRLFDFSEPMADSKVGRDTEYLMLYLKRLVEATEIAFERTAQEIEELRGTDDEQG